MQNYDATAITGPARAWVVDTCTFRAAQTNTQLLSITSSNFATKNCTFRWDEDPDQRALGKINGEGQFQFFKIVDFPGDGNDDATNLPDPENALLLEDCSFVFQGVSMQSVAGNLDVVWPTLHRDRTVTYTNCTTNIDATQFNVVNPIP